jgi:phosphoribosylaminoimidazolecarboxamide formyltransferase/IMP cyclohydrolase
MAEKDLKQMYRTRTEGEFPDRMEVMGRPYVKVENLRYGTNPHQPAAFYRPADGKNLVLGAYHMLKSGKSGLSQTNIEDMHHAVGILKYLQRPACAVMKHCNPSGAAIQVNGMPLVEVYQRARDADAQAAFGAVVVFNVQVDAATAKEIMQTVIESVAAPDFAPDALDILNNSDKFGKNKELRIIKLPDFSTLPRFTDEGTAVRELKVFDDGSIVVAVPYLSRVKSAADFVPAYNDHKTKGRIEIARKPTERELGDLLFAWYVNIHVRSNGCVIAKNGQTICIGTGEQDRVGAVRKALAKAKEKYKGVETLEGAAMSSDGFFPFRDAVDAATREGITAIVQPGGSVNDYEAIEACNESGASMVFAMERCFSHH